MASRGGSILRGLRILLRTNSGPTSTRFGQHWPGLVRDRPGIDQASSDCGQTWYDVSQCRPESARSRRPMLVKFGLELVPHVAQTWRISAKLGWERAKIGSESTSSKTTLANVGPTLTKLGSKLPTFDQNWPGAGQFGSNSTKLGLSSAKQIPGSGLEQSGLGRTPMLPASFDARGRTAQIVRERVGGRASEEALVRECDHGERRFECFGLDAQHRRVPTGHPHHGDVPRDSGEAPRHPPRCAQNRGLVHR